MEVKPGFRDQKKFSSPLSRGAPSREITDTKITEYVNIFFGAKFCVPWVKVSQRKCFTAHLPRVVKIWKIEAGSVFKRVANAQSVLKIICPPKDTSHVPQEFFSVLDSFLILLKPRERPQDPAQTERNPTKNINVPRRKCCECLSTNF